MHIVDRPQVILATINPLHAVHFFVEEPVPRLHRAWARSCSRSPAPRRSTPTWAISAASPIKCRWLYFVLPALLLNYMGQGAMLMNHGRRRRRVETVKNPFFYLAPEMLRLPLVLLATMATIIASQAVISGAFSVTQQAIQLGFVPRLRITHTSESAAGQIYIPVVNWALMVMVILLVLTFGSSSNLAAAYGIAVTGAMLIDAVLIAVVLLQLWKWNRVVAIGLLALFFTVDGLYLAANLLKVPDGGWFPLLVGAVAFTLLTTWAKGRKLMIDRMNEASLPMEIFIKSAAASADARARHRGVHDQLGERRAARAAAQPQAQQGASRARHPADREDRGRALRRPRKAGRDQGLWLGLLPRGPALRLHGGDRRSRGAAQARRLRARRAR